MSWRRILLLTFCLLTVLVGTTWFVLQRTGAATGIVRSILKDLLAAEFDLERAQVDLLSGELTLDEFAVDDPQRPGSKLLEARQLRLDVETDPLGQVGTIHELIAEGLVLDIDLTEGRAPDIGRLLRSQLPEGSTGGNVTPARVSNASARVRVDADTPTLAFSGVQLNLRHVLLPDGKTDARRGVINGRAHFDNLDLDVELLGDLDMNTGWCRLQTKVDKLVVDTTFLRRLLPLLRTELAEDVASGHLHHMTLHLDLPLSTTGTNEIVAGCAFEFSGVHCRLPMLPIPLRNTSVRGVVSTKDGGTGQFTAEHLLPTGETELVAKISDVLTKPLIEVRGTGRSIVIDDSVYQALGSFRAGAAVLDGLRPTAGSADFDLFLRNPGGDDEVADLDLLLRDVALSYHGFGDPESRTSFPLPIVDANGRVQLRDRVISIEDVTAHIAGEAGGGEISMSGRVDPSLADPVAGKLNRVSLDLFAPNLQCTPALRDAFGALLKDGGAAYDQFAPQGAAAVRLRIRPDDESGRTPWQVDVTPLGASITWDRFPLPLSDVRGQVRLQDEGMEIDLVATKPQPQGDRPATARLRGRLLAPDSNPGAIVDGSMEIRVEGTDIPLDQDLRRASTHLTPELAQVWDELQPSGRADTSLLLRRSHGDAPIIYDLDLTLKEGRCLPRSFPTEVTRLQGNVFVHGRDDSARVHVDTVRGLLQEDEGPGCELAVVGTIVAADNYEEDLTVVLRDLQLTKRFGALLEASGAAAPGTWDVLAPSGVVDVVSRQATTDGADHQRSFTVLLRDTASNAEMLPQPATEVTGELKIQDGELTFEEIRARMGKAFVNCRDGRVGGTEIPGRTEVRFAVSCEAFPLDDTLSRLFVGPLRQAVLDRQMRGHLNLNGLQLAFLLPSEGSDEPIEIALQGNVEARSVELVLGARLQEIHGSITLQDSRVTRDGGQIRGHLTRGAMELYGHRAQEIDADFTIDAERLVVYGLECAMHGGRLSSRAESSTGPSMVYEFGQTDEDEGTLAADLDIRGLGLREVMAASGKTDSTIYGTIHGWLRVDRLQGVDLVDMTGAGRLEVVDGNLGTVPVFAALYAEAGEASRPRFESMAVDFAVKDRGISLSDLTVRSPLITVTGGGNMTMEGYVDIVMTTDSLFGGSADLLLLPPVIQMITSNLVRVHLHGHLRDLQTEQRWFAQRNPGRRRLLPVAPRLEPRTRPDF